MNFAKYVIALCHRSAYPFMVGVAISSMIFYFMFSSGPSTSVLEGARSSYISGNLRHNLKNTGGGVLLDTSEADRLKKSVRIVTWVMTHPANHRKRCDAIKQTWGKRADTLLFMSSGDDSILPTINLNFSIDNRDQLWPKTRKAFTYVYNHHLEDGDWFMRADDDTYIIFENLRYLLSIYDPNIPLLVGGRFRKFSKQGYIGGGSGSIMSKAALKIFVEKGLAEKLPCGVTEPEHDDVAIGYCLNRYGVQFVDTRDERGRGRFFPFTPGQHLEKNTIYKDHWYWDYIYYQIPNDRNCCSSTAIGFHYMDARHMLEADYLLYTLRPYGLSYSFSYPPPLPPDLTTVPKEVLRKYG